MSEEIKNVEQQPEENLSELLQIRRDKLAALQEEGRDPFVQTKFARTAFSAEIKNDYDSFEENIQVEEIVPEEYEDWLESIRREEATEWFDDVVRSIFIERS